MSIDVPQGTAAMSDDDNLTAAENVMRAEEGDERLPDNDSTILGAGGSAGGCREMESGPMNTMLP